MGSSAALDGGEEYKEGSSGNTGETRWLGSRGPLTVTMSACCSKMSTATCLRPRMPKSAGASMAGHAYLSAESYVECTGLVGEARPGSVVRGMLLVPRRCPDFMRFFSLFHMMGFQTTGTDSKRRAL